MKPVGNLILALLIPVTIAVLPQARAQAPSAESSSEPTAKRLREPGWWPTKGDAARNDYSGTEACAGCHEHEVRTQRQTSMAKAASRALETPVLRSSSALSLDSPPFHTIIQRDPKGSTYTVGRGGEAIS